MKKIWVFICLGLCLATHASAKPSCQDSRQEVFNALASEVSAQMEKYAQKMGTKKWTYETAVRDLPCQVGSLTKLLMQSKNERDRHQQTDAEIRERISDELADLLSLVIFIAHEQNINLADAWQKMLESDENKFKKHAAKKIKLEQLQ